MPLQLSNPFILQSLLAFILIIVGPLFSYYIERPLLFKDPSPGKKFKFYRTIILTQWPLAALAVFILDPARIFLFSPNTLQSSNFWLRIVLIGLLAGFFIVALLPYINCIRGEAARAKTEAAFRRQLGKLLKMLPDSYPERHWFIALSITAGVCEEILFRGFLTRYLTVNFHFPLYAAVLITAVAFGLNHIYQGYRGVLQTAIVGLALSGIYLLTGNLLLPMLIHAALDLMVVFILRPSAPNNQIVNPSA